MTAQSTRILKEARPLFWPWCAVALSTVPALFRPLNSLGQMTVIGLFLGVPLLATLPLGNEFQHRTFALLLSQPIGRMKIWREKLMVSAVAVVSAVIVLCVGLRVGPYPLYGRLWFLPGALIVATIASATFWTLVSRSTIGGVALTVAAEFFIIIALNNLTFWAYRVDFLAVKSSITVPTFALVFLCYAVIMLYLSARKFARFQATGTALGDDLLTGGPDVMPGAMARWLRCRPAGVTPNLVRKELRLLRPVWLITLLAAVGWACLTLFGLLHEHRFSRDFETVVVSVTVVSTLMIAILAGSLSLGEEKTLGTHAWQMTLPVSALRQWLIKLSAALFAGVVGAGVLPALTFYRFTPPALVDMKLRAGWLLVAAVLTFAAFWCACAVDGTVAAVLWVVPTTVVLGFAGYFAKRWANGLADSFLGHGSFENGSDWLLMNVAHHRNQMLKLLGNLRFDWWVARVVNHHFHVVILLDNPMFYAALVGGPALILALVQSYRLFRAPNRGNSRSVVRNLLPLALLVFLCSFSLTAFNAFWQRAGLQVFFFTSVTSHAIEKALPAAAKLHPTEALQLTGDDVAKAWSWPLENSTRRWLSGARITVTPDQAHPGGFFCTLDPWGKTWCSYSATIHLADGTDIFESRGPVVDHKQPFGHYSVRVRWLGAAREEVLWDR